MASTRKTLCTMLAIAGAATVASADITFTAGPTLATPQRPSDTALGDFNGDGFKDIAVTTDTLDKVTFYFGDGIGGFTGPTNLLLPGGAGADSIESGDFNGDGNMDLAVVLQNLNIVQLYTGNGLGAFTPGATAVTGAEPRSMRAVDIDGDGDPDLITANRTGLSASVIVNTGGVLTAITIPVGDEPRGVAAGDFDGDGDMELVVGRRNLRDIAVFTNTANVFGGMTTYSVGAAQRPSEIDTGDINGDGLTDIVVATDFASVFTNTGAGFTGPVNNATGGLNPDTIRVVDLNGDGANDIAVVNQDSNNVAALENLGSGVFGAAVTSPAGTRPGGMEVGDLNGDGGADIAVANRDSDNTTVVFTAGGPPPPVCTADFDGDGVVNSNDFFSFLDAFFTGCPTP